jgi:hypothetical protein
MFEKAAGRNAEPYTSELEIVPEAIRRIVNRAARQLALSFFVYFSRMEYALKRSCYCHANPKSKAAEPAWDRFAKDHDSKFAGNAADELTGATGARALCSADGRSARLTCRFLLNSRWINRLPTAKPARKHLGQAKR